jgi:serine/threonine protein kinase
MANRKSPPQPSAAPPGPLEAGTLLQKRYLIERLIGGGGMGMVYLAQDQRLANRPCAIKEMVDHFIDPQQRIEANEYFAREADTLAQLKHNAIPAISDRFDDQNRHYLVMEYVEGRDLEQELAARGGPLPEGLVIDIARQLCDVLGYLHTLTPPIVYRDMKPSNVMLTPRGRVVLVDFGIARLFKAQRKGTMIGTLGFAPPEQYQGVADPRGDIYSLGATLHYVTTGRDPEKFPPFSFPPVRDLRPEISSNLGGAIDRALAYEMNDRPASIQEFRDMLLYGRGLAAIGSAHVNPKSGTGELARTTLPPEVIEALSEPPRKPVSWGRRLFGITLFTLVLAGGAFGATYLYSNPQLQEQLGVKPFIESLPWKHQELVAKAMERPLEFERMTLELSTRAGEELSAPKAIFTNTELANARYLKWKASFRNRLAGLESRSDKIQARFFDPSGTQIASSADSRFVGPAQTAADFSGVALIPDTSAISAGNYKVALYTDDKLLAEQRFTVTQDLAAIAAAERAKAASVAAARAEEQKQRAEAQRLAMIQERMSKPLQLETIEFVNSTKDGTVLAGPSGVFNVSKVLFVAWRAIFQNRLAGLDTNQYRVDATYVAPDGTLLGSVNDFETVRKNQPHAVFSGRVGNSAGGAFLPGQYTVNFYLNGHYVAQKKFRVVADAGLPYGRDLSGAGGSAGGGGTGGGTAAGLETPTLASGTIDGINGRDNVPMELRLRPQPNGFLHGELVVHLSGYEVTPLDGFVRGNHVEFQAAHGAETLYFEGERHRDNNLSGTFEIAPTGTHGTWNTRAD